MQQRRPRVYARRVARHRDTSLRDTLIVHAVTARAADGIEERKEVPRILPSRTNTVTRGGEYTAVKSAGDKRDAVSGRVYAEY